MTTSDFNKYARLILNYCYSVLSEKTKEYVLDNDDRLKAFKWDWLNTKNEKNEKIILWGQMAKHLSSIYDYCLKNEADFDRANYSKWIEKITDTINYLIILLAIVKERSGQNDN